MAKKISGYIKLQIPAGAANPSPPVGPALGQHNVPIMDFVRRGAALDPGSDGEGGPYSHLEDPPGVGPGKDFTATQKRKIFDANRERNGGRLRDDDTGRYLSTARKSQRGVRPPEHEAQVDHIVPKSPADPSISPGTNSYRNAKVLSRKRNREKSNN